MSVLQVGCRSRGDEACSFAFGSDAAVNELYGRLMEDGDLGAALGGL